MIRADAAGHLERCLAALTGGFLFYYREALGPNEQTPFGEKLDDEAAVIFHDVVREDEKHVNDLLDAIEGLGEKADLGAHYKMDSFYFNYLDPKYMVRILADHLDEDAQAFEAAAGEIVEDERVGGLVAGLLSDKRRQAQRFRDLNEKRKAKQEKAGIEGK